MASYGREKGFTKELTMTNYIEQLIKRRVFAPLKPIDTIPCFHFDCSFMLTDLLLPLNPHSHKGTFGHIVAVEGHDNFLGASRLSMLAALRVGAGLATLWCKDHIHHHPADLFEFIKKTDRDISPDFLKKITALVIGPGLSKESSLQNWGLEILNQAGNIVPTLIIDADALTLLEHIKPGDISSSLMCTPHPKEAADLLKVDVKDVENDRFSALRELKNLPINSHCSIIWLLKGSTTLIFDKQYGIFALEGNAPLLSTGGSGDILAGALAGLIPQTSSLLEASILAVNLMIRAARENSSRADRGIFPSELSEAFPYLLKRSS